MNYFQKLPNSRRAPPGLEWVTFKKLPIILLGGTLVPLVAALASRLFPPDGTPAQIEKHLASVDILLIATVVVVWMSVFIVAIGCLVVILMKGPGYIADAYHLDDSEQPVDRYRSDR